MEFRKKESLIYIYILFVYTLNAPCESLAELDYNSGDLLFSLALPPMPGGTWVILVI